MKDGQAEFAWVAGYILMSLPARRWLPIPVLTWSTYSNYIDRWSRPCYYYTKLPPKQCTKCKNLLFPIVFSILCKTPNVTYIILFFLSPLSFILSLLLIQLLAATSNKDIFMFVFMKLSNITCDLEKSFWKENCHIITKHNAVTLLIINNCVNTWKTNSSFHTGFSDCNSKHWGMLVRNN